MKAIFYTRQEQGKLVETDWRESNLARALQAGAREHGDDIEIRTTESAIPRPGELEGDMIVKVGVKSRYWFRAAAQLGIPWLYFDKGYIRERAPDQWLNYWRMAVNSHHPIDYLASAKHGSDRANKAGSAFNFAPWRDNSVGPVVIDGGSEKNFKFNGIIPESGTIRDVDRQCQRVVEAVQRVTSRPVIYRPKPSSPGRQPIAGTEWARERAGVNKKDVFHDLERASCVVTYNGAICFDAHRIGVPSIVLGSGPARPISSTMIEEINNPRRASDIERRQWVNNLAWCQFGMDEIKAGLCWQIVKEMLAVTPIKTPSEACPCTPL